jgi:hypothetical protein
MTAQPDWAEVAIDGTIRGTRFFRKWAERPREIHMTIERHALALVNDDGALLVRSNAVRRGGSGSPWRTLVIGGRWSLSQMG